ncbi:bifunctional folylpolyglutamate synthase/dihydrofolate synthase [Planktothrix agardhii 1032]|uniref:bifunctional folylpolyglutamate synthase/dihydrofolate synthase n=1 Tax=Planktothrix agardhii TaxID=1160 RepID=UPI001D0BB358|nr:folylpolyglutamate synthase/dihydrofolate synthase family protein [Planktothrix agardhii]MCB8779314.1 bifunctional folylpolyglutamate synthase/dihydrofolate synthase [Planktothrix agardhii 1031]MCF3597195.1 bifunctional folylpolyglutamate synthase/dihydrofolate synthase [Planktothrix agardhii 1032]
MEKFLQKYQQFGINLGLERIKNLLKRLGNPHLNVPIIHVAGTNGKGSVCAYLSSILSQAGYRVGRYISPHLVDWTERLSINQQPISQSDFLEVLQQVENAILPDEFPPTLFEVVTVAAWLYFAQQKVDIAVMEVGLGGRLDATNVCDYPLVSVITSIGLDHQEYLGSTIAEIAFEKAGIIKPNCPVVVGILPPDAQQVIQQRATELNAPVTWVKPAVWVKQNGIQQTANYQGLEYPLPLLGNIQLINSAIAIATIQILHQQGWKISENALIQGIEKAQWPGRLQWITWKQHRLLIDGAHNPAAAVALREYVDSLEVSSISWVMGMLSTKDHTNIFKALLRPSDQLYLVPIPNHPYADPQQLATLAKSLCPDLKYYQTYPTLILALDTAIQDENTLPILCGSLYLLGDFFQLLEKT